MISLLCYGFITVQHLCLLVFDINFDVQTHANTCLTQIISRETQHINKPGNLCVITSACRSYDFAGRIFATKSSIELSHTPHPTFMFTRLYNSLRYPTQTTAPLVYARSKNRTNANSWLYRIIKRSISYIHEQHCSISI